MRLLRRLLGWTDSRRCVARRIACFVLILGHSFPLPFGSCQADEYGLRDAMYALNSRNVREVTKAIRSLKVLGAKAAPAVPCLIEKLSDERPVETDPQNSFHYIGPEPLIADLAAEALAMIGESTVPFLATFVSSGAADHARLRGIRILRGFGQSASDAIDALKKCAVDEDEVIRFYALDALPRVTEDLRSVVPLLISALKDNDPNVRSAAVLGLGFIGPQAGSAVPELLPILDDDASRTAWYTSDSAGVRPVYDDVVDSLVALAKASPDRAPSIMHAMHTHANGQVRAGAALVMIRTSSKKREALMALKRVLEERREGVDKALEALKELKVDGREAEALVVGFLKHDDELIRFQAIDTLGAIAGEAGISALIETMGDDDVVVRSRAAQALGNLGPNARRAVPVLAKAVVHPDTPRSFLLRSRAAQALGEIGPAARPAVPTLLGVLKNNEQPGDFRGAAASALGNIAPRDPEVLTTLRTALQDTPRWFASEMRGAAAAALGKAGPAAESAVRLLTTILNDASAGGEVRASAARSLGQIGVTSEEVVSALSQALREQEGSLYESLRRESASALGALRARSALQALEKVSRDTSEYESVRKAAAASVRLIRSPR